jgi:hypothetical protein
MAKGAAPLDEERLPWLEPYRDVIARKQKVARRSHGGLVAVVAGLGVLFAAGGGYWLGQRWGEPAPAPVIRTAEAPVTSAPVVPPPAVAPAPSEGPPPATTQPAAKKVVAAAPKKTVRRSVRQRKIRTAGIENARIREVRAAQERAAPPTPPPAPPQVVAQTNARPWPKMPSPGPAGRVVQLGAFRTEGRALAAYRSRLARYPVLASMPRVVVPVVTKPRGKVLYVLRLGTASRQQSKIVCRNLRASGDHCIVIG